MRLSKEVYDQRMLQIIGATLRFVRNGNAVENIPTALFVKQYGFTANFSKTAELDSALKNMVVWVNNVRLRTNASPSPERMLAFIKNRL